MSTPHGSTQERVRALVLVVAWLGTAWLNAMSGAAHAAVTGTVAAWGENFYGQTNVPAGLRGVRAIAAGGEHTVALKSDGTLVAWGWNFYGQTNVPAGLQAVRAIAAGFDHTVALRSDGTVVAWGDNGFGQADVPAGLGGVRAIAAGGLHTVALKSNGTVVAWGRDWEGQTNVPAGLGGVRAIAAGYSHTVALKSDGMVVAWGDNDQGQSDVLAGLRDVMAISAGVDHTVALRSSYRFGGFLDPVNAPPIVNTLQAGAGVPVKFILGSDKGLGIFASGYPASRVVACRPNATTDEIEQTVQADNSSLRFDASTNTYTYVWKTGPFRIGQCRRLILRFADGIEHTALFQFR